ncbi:MAG: hypothetical protein ACI8PZ_002464 [Myxococcota bacterium]|jgi:hypothetical protein
MRRHVFTFLLAVACGGSPKPGADTAAGAEARLVVTPAWLDFGTLAAGESTVASFSVANGGDGELTLDALELDAPASFALLTPVDLPLVLSDAPVAIEVSYLSTGAAEHGQVVLISSDPITPELAVGLVAGSPSALPMLTVPPSVDFGTVEVGDSATASVRLSNTGGGPLTVSELTLDGAVWTLTAAPALPLDLVPGEAIDLDIGFTPTEDGPAVGALDIGTDDPRGPSRVSLMGHGALVTTSGGVEFDVHYSAADLAIVLDTSAAMPDAAASLAEGLERELASFAYTVPDLTIGVASFEDYAVAPFGAPGDAPFRIEQQQTTDVSLAMAALSTVRRRDGGDGPASAYEALYQLGNGFGWDADCDGNADPEVDLPPLIPRPEDAFRGLASGVWDPAVPGTGDQGGLGFRAGVLPLHVLVSVNEVRDPEGGYDSPGGCTMDASFYDAYVSSAERGAKFVGVMPPGADAIGRGQLEAIAIVTDSFGDFDGDRVDEPAVVDWDGLSPLAPLIGSAVRAVLDRQWLDDVHLEVDDPDGHIVRITPDRFADVEMGSRIAFAVEVRGRLADRAGPRTVEVPVSLRDEDGLLLERRVLFVAP